MISNEVIKADLLAKLKASAALTALLKAAKDIKESQYAGTEIEYPGVRLKVNRQIAITDRGHCDHARLTFSVRVLTEGASSLEADEIAGVVNGIFHGPDGKFFQGTGWYSYFRSSGLISPFRTGQETWQSEADFEGVVYPTA
jgi:hypothetical protein